MKRLILCVALCFASCSGFTACSSVPAPAARVASTRTLKAVGESAEAAVKVSALLYSQGKITAKQAREVIDFYDQKFQPVWQVAANAVQADLSSVASPDVLALSGQLLNLVARLQN